MGFERAPFGDGSASGAGNVTTAVHTHFGALDSENVQGNVKTEGKMNQLFIEVTGEDVTALAYPLLAPILPAGAVIEDVYAEVTEAFVLGGTTPTILVGTETSEVTNGFVLNETQAEAAGTYDLTNTLTGTWDSPLAAATTLGLSLGGTSPTNTAAGKVRFVINYFDMTG